MLRRVAVVIIDVSEELSTTIIRVTRRSVRRLLVTATFLVHRFLSHWRWRRKVHPKRRFLQEPHGVTSQKTPFFTQSRNFGNFFYCTLQLRRCSYVCYLPSKEGEEEEEELSCSACCRVIFGSRVLNSGGHGCKCIQENISCVLLWSDGTRIAQAVWQLCYGRDKRLQIPLIPLYGYYWDGDGGGALFLLYSSRDGELTTHCCLVLRLWVLGLYITPPIHLHGMVLN
jgi:hypothetical protein